LSNGGDVQFCSFPWISPFQRFTSALFALDSTQNHDQWQDKNQIIEGFIKKADIQPLIQSIFETPPLEINLLLKASTGFERILWMSAFGRLYESQSLHGENRFPLPGFSFLFQSPVSGHLFLRFETRIQALRGCRAPPRTFSPTDGSITHGITSRHILRQEACHRSLGATQKRRCNLLYNNCLYGRLATSSGAGPGVGVQCKRILSRRGDIGLTLMLAARYTIKCFYKKVFQEGLLETVGLDLG